MEWFYQQKGEPPYVPDTPPPPIILQPTFIEAAVDDEFLLELEQQQQLHGIGAILPIVTAAEVGNKLLAPVNLAETWTEHFISRGWNTIRDQINAGYPYFVQPVPQQGEYTETIDYGAVFNNVIVNLDWKTVPVSGTVTVTSWIESSIDGVTWTAPVAGSTLFVQSFRFLRITIRFQAAN